MKNCKNCLIIRYFIISVLFIIIIALVFTDKMKYLSFVNPEKFSYFRSPNGDLGRCVNNF